MKRNIRQIKQELSNFRGVVGNFARRGKKSLIREDENDEGKSKEQLLTEKCEIINRMFFGDDQNEWKNPEELLDIIFQMMRYEFSEHGKDTVSLKALTQVTEVLFYLEARRENNNPKPASLAVSEPLKRVANLHKLLKRVTDAWNESRHDYEEEIHDWLVDWASDLFEKIEYYDDEDLKIRIVQDPDSVREELFFDHIDDYLYNYCKNNNIDPMECLAGNEDRWYVSDLQEDVSDCPDALDPAYVDGRIRCYLAESEWELVFNKFRQRYIDKGWHVYEDEKAWKPTADDIFTAFVNDQKTKMRNLCRDANSKQLKLALNSVRKYVEDNPERADDFKYFEFAVNRKR